MEGATAHKHFRRHRFVALPPEMVHLIACHLVQLSSAQVCWTARLVCQEWKRLVARQADPLVWCQRLWRQRPLPLQPCTALNWPFHPDFPLGLMPGLLELIMFCDDVWFRHHLCFWSEVTELACRLLTLNATEADGAAWSMICSVMPSAPTECDVHYILFHANRFTLSGLHACFSPAIFGHLVCCLPPSSVCNLVDGGREKKWN